MILHDIADRSGLIIKCATALNAEVLGHCDLNAFNIIAVPERFQKGIGEAKDQHIVHGPLAKIVVNAVHVGLVECAQEHSVQFLGRGQIIAEGLFDDDACSLAATGVRQFLYHWFK